MKHYNFKHGKYIYRKLSFGIYNMKKECQICNKSDGVIDVHHKDKNRENNCKNNLQILCHS